MYEILCHLGDLFFQGLLTSLFIFLLARWYENRVTSKKAKVAALFIVSELEAHLAVLKTIIQMQSFPAPNDDDYCFRTQNWEEFKNDLVPLLKYEDLEKLVTYYQSINLILAGIRRSKTYTENPTIVTNSLEDAEYFCKQLWLLTSDSNSRHTSKKESQG